MYSADSDSFRVFSSISWFEQPNKLGFLSSSSSSHDRKQDSLGRTMENTFEELNVIKRFSQRRSRMELFTLQIILFFTIQTLSANTLFMDFKTHSTWRLLSWSLTSLRFRLQIQMNAMMHTWGSIYQESPLMNLIRLSVDQMYLPV